MARSIEEEVEDAYKAELDRLKVKRYTKTEPINPEIKAALEQAESKSGGSGGNYPDIQAYLDDGHARRIPVMMECKGKKNKLEKLNKDGSLASDSKSVSGYAVNGAVHYGQALLNGISDLSEVIVIGMNGSKLNSDGQVEDLTCKAFYMSEKNGNVPKHIPELDDDLVLLKDDNVSSLYEILDGLSLTEVEREQAKQRTEAQLEASVKRIHQSLYEDDKIKNLLEMNEKLYLFTGLIMAGLKTKGVAPLVASDFHGNNDGRLNDGVVVLNRIEAFLAKKSSSPDKNKMVLSLLKPIFEKPALWKPHNGVSILKTLYLQVQEEIVPLLESPLHLDFSGKILNSLNDWVTIENDAANDVVLTPRYVTTFMARLCRTDMNSMVWDRAMGSGGFLVSAMDIMIRDAQSKIKDIKELAEKIENIKKNQLLGIEILGNIYILAVLNMVLMGDGSSKIYYEDSHQFKEKFPATVFLLNPPYSADGKGFNFVEEALNQMTSGFAAVLIQENAGSGQGMDYTKRVLQNNTLVASIHMPENLFSGKSSAQTAIYVFEVNKPHGEDKLVKFIDFSDDGYTRSKRKKTTQANNLRDTGDAKGKYAEAEAIVLGKKPKTNYFTKENGLLIEDTISLNGDDWTFAQHKVIDVTPSEDDLMKTIGDHLAWKANSMSGSSIPPGADDYDLTDEDEQVLDHQPDFGEFILNDIAHLEYGNKFDNNKMTYSDPTINFVSRTAFNNGVSDVVDAMTNVEPYPAGDITLAFGGSIGSTFLQDCPFYTGQNVGVIELPPEITPKAKMYFASALEKMCKAKYVAFSHEINKYFKVDLTVVLPMDSNGDPDWNYMDRYVRAIEKLAVKDAIARNEDFINKLKSVVAAI